MKIKSLVITIFAPLLLIIAGCSSQPEEASMGEVEKEIYTQEQVESMFSEDSLEAAKERIEERGGADYIVPPEHTAIGENQATVVELKESDILDGEDSSFEKYDNVGEIRLDTLELDSTFEDQDKYTNVLLKELGMQDSYYATHFPLLWTAGILSDGLEEHSDGTKSFYLSKYSVLVNCHYKGANADVNEKLLSNLKHAYKNNMPIIVYGEYEQYLSEEGYADYRLIIHRIGFKEVI
ncbi:hypothetical protein [Lysinibacillus tabacifolii]|uniref:Uncharacterized protein n=1 Tax=Lysinibacillus tabacifolii TaxID=1173107 RepID=A0ABY2SWC0_9BACI|nr:hypothetical protein [Lysinibacillus tabacifolii]TKI47603.1 hypothetical protein FC748_08050 [Lysinibacillus tabacifolii]